MVTDEDNQPLRGVSITIKGRTGGGATSEEGTFLINVPDTKSTLVFSSVGFAQQEVALRGRTSISLQLKSELTSLSDVVVVHCKEKRYYGAVSSVKFDERQASQLTSVDKLL